MSVRQGFEICLKGSVLTLKKNLFFKLLHKIMKPGIDEIFLSQNNNFRQM